MRLFRNKELEVDLCHLLDFNGSEVPSQLFNVSLGIRVGASARSCVKHEAAEAPAQQLPVFQVRREKRERTATCPSVCGGIRCPMNSGVARAGTPAEYRKVLFAFMG